VGTSTNAMLMYGYDLGSGDAEWAVAEVNEDGELTVNWPGLDDEGFEEAAMAVMFAGVGFTETDWRADGYYDRKREAEARLGVEIDTHCSADYPRYVLAAHVITVYRGSSEAIDFGALTAQAAADDWDGKLAAALALLGLTPAQDRPQWLLASYWG
jgi:hypothetical protein